MNENLNKIGKDYNWLLIEVEKFGFKPEEALLVTYDGKGQIFCQKKENKKGNQLVCKKSQLFVLFWLF